MQVFHSKVILNYRTKYCKVAGKELYWNSEVLSLIYGSFVD